MNIIYQINNAFLELIFILSFYSKIKNVKSFSYDVLSYEVTPKRLVSVSVMIILLLEFFLFIAYAYNLFYPYKEFITLLVLLFFSTIVLIKRKKKGDTSSCSCFGNLSLLNKFPLIRNILLIVYVLFHSIVNKSEHYYFIQGTILLLSGVLLVLIYEYISTTYLQKKLRRSHVTNYLS